MASNATLQSYSLKKGMASVHLFKPLSGTLCELILSSLRCYKCVQTCVNVLMITHYNDVIMGEMASQITGLTIVYSTVYSDQRKHHQSSASLAFVWGIHRWPVNSPHKGPVTRKMFPFDDVIMNFFVCHFETVYLAGAHHLTLEWNRIEYRIEIGWK